ncbi:MAG: hypothetical protein NTU66_02205 [Elusimicrobia bacterium]|nr:hypothetical protein [Elusimicrobiota bacterium]
MSPKKTVKTEGKKSSVVAGVAKKAVAAKKTAKTTGSLQKKSIGNASSSPLTSLATALPSSDVTYIIIDFPIENETVSGLHYAIRIGASSNGIVELSINNGPWEGCRFTDGYWWYDWGYYLPGTAKISARLVDEKGKLLKRASVRKVVVV